MNKMVKIEQIFKDLSLGSVFADSLQPVRDYEKESSNIYKPEAARFKLAVWFKDGNSRYFFSYDNKNNGKGVTICDEYEGLLKLLRLAHSFKGKYKNLVIYATFDPYKMTSQRTYNTEVLKFDLYGNKKTNNFVNFVTSANNVFLDIERLKYGENKIK